LFRIKRAIPSVTTIIWATNMPTQEWTTYFRKHVTCTCKFYRQMGYMYRSAHAFRAPASCRWRTLSKLDVFNWKEELSYVKMVFWVKFVLVLYDMFRNSPYLFPKQTDIDFLKT